MGRREDHRSCRGLRGESMDRFKVDDLGAESFNDSNSTGRCAETHGDSARENYPRWNWKFTRLWHRHVSSCDERHGDDSHSLLRVVAAVGESHKASG